VNGLFTGWSWRRWHLRLSWLDKHHQHTGCDGEKADAQSAAEQLLPTSRHVHLLAGTPKSLTPLKSAVHSSHITRRCNATGYLPAVIILDLLSGPGGKICPVCVCVCLRVSGLTLGKMAPDIDSHEANSYKNYKRVKCNHIRVKSIDRSS